MAFAIVPSLRAEIPLNYWSFNAQSLAPTLGQAGTDLLTVDIGFGGEGYGAGTLLNHVDGYPAGYSLRYYAAAEVASFQQLTFRNLNFVDALDARMSFATFSEHVFQFSESMVVDYSIDGGAHFVGAQTLENPGSAWTLREVDFGTALNGKSGVQIRLRTSASFEVGSTLAFDNVQIVPEPSVFALLAAGGVFSAAVLFRRKSTR